jgi:hypothetical protein
MTFPRQLDADASTFDHDPQSILSDVRGHLAKVQGELVSGR